MDQTRRANRDQLLLRCSRIIPAGVSNRSPIWPHLTAGRPESWCSTARTSIPDRNTFTAIDAGYRLFLAGFLPLRRLVVESSARRIAARIRSTLAGRDCSTWCSQMRRTVHPARRSRRKFVLSRARFAAIFSCHRRDSLCLQSGNLQPCQKSPSTNTATRSARNRMSGRPARSDGCVSNERSNAASSATRAFSGPVFLPRMRDMSALRLAALIMSPRCTPQAGCPLGDHERCPAFFPHRRVRIPATDS